MADNKGEMIAQVKRTPYRSSVIFGGVAILCVCVVMAVNAIAVIPIFGFLLTLYGFGVLLRAIYLIWKFVSNKIKQETAREKVILEAKNPLL